VELGGGLLISGVMENKDGDLGDLGWLRDLRRVGTDSDGWL
jgi:hypothetical protein